MAFRNFDRPEISRRTLLRGGSLLGAGAALGVVPIGHVALARSPVASWPTVRKTVESYVADGKVANMVATLGWKQAEPQIIAKGALTIGKPAKAGADSLYRIYSQTKPVTGIATMMLVDEGEIGLDQPIADFLPKFADMRVLKKADGPLDDTVPAERPITVRHLLTHTAGLSYDIMAKGPLQKAFNRLGLTSGQLSKLPIPGLPDVESAPGLEVWADRLATLPLIAQPGAKWSYSASIDLLGRIIEVASGARFDEFLQSRLFDPCGMDSTFFKVPASETGRLTTNYGVFNGMLLPMDPAASSIYAEAPPILWGGSGLVCSPRDYDRFQRMLVGKGMIDGKRVMSEAAVRVGTGNLLPKGANLAGTWVAGQQFGAGGRVTGTAFGWGGAAGTTSFVDMASGLRAANYTQYMPAEAYEIQRGFPDIVLKDLAAMQGA